MLGSSSVSGIHDSRVGWNLGLQLLAEPGWLIITGFLPCAGMTLKGDLVIKSQDHVFIGSAALKASSINILLNKR
jgi:hypothetical protein